MKNKSYNQSRFQNLLRTAFYDIRDKNPRFSVRAFSKRLQIDSGALSGILSGKRKVSKQMAERILKTITVSPSELREVMEVAEKQPSNTSPIERFEVESNYFEVVSEWEHFAFLSLVETDSFKLDTVWIAGRLGITPTRVETVIDNLKKAGLIEIISSRKGVKLLKRALRTTDQVTSMAVRRAHHRDLELKRQKLDSIDVANRDFSAMTMAINPERLPEAVQLIREFENSLCALIEVAPKKEVYRLCVQLFPLTAVNTERKK